MNGSYNSLCRAACEKKAGKKMQKAGAGRPAAVSACAAEAPGRTAA